MNNPISSVAFDVGGVLIHLNYHEGLKKILPHCDRQRAVCSEAFFGLIRRDPSMAEYESGQISTREFFNRFAMQTGYRGTLEEFRDTWLDIFSENTPMIEFGRELAQTLNVYAWSNAGEMHFPWIYERFPSLNFFKGDAISCYLGAVKPNRAFFERALARCELRPEQVLFVDDRPENVEAAREYSITTVQYTAPTETIAAMRAILAGAKP
ncbi:MAG: HAD family phosphatase [Kiritimatiellaeota bacterium]|nr:HAD family phosphatase [Kiritimatiellota bacterium]